MRKLLKGISLSFLSLGISIISTLIVYRSLWNNGNSSAFSSWISIFELAQFFLLADIGFTHKYIRDREKNYLKLALLRGRLLLVGLLAGLILLLLSFSSSSLSNIGLMPIVSLSLSTFITLYSYADAAELRSQERYSIAYPLQIISQLAFIIITFILTNRDPIFSISIAIITRSAILSIGQFTFLRKNYAIKFSSKNSIDITVLAFNGGYFILFLLDGLIMVWANVPSYLTATTLIIRKYFDIIRGFSDSALQVFSNKFSKEKTNPTHAIYFFIILLFVYSIGFFLAKIGLIKFWISSDISVTDTALLILALNGFSISAYRWMSSIEYFNNSKKINYFFFFAIIAKLSFCATVFYNEHYLYIAYGVQSGIAISLITLYLYKKNKSID
jgi:hypothetical protein